LLSIGKQIDIVIYKYRQIENFLHLATLKG
jgi:hypothetical protein